MGSRADQILETVLDDTGGPGSEALRTAASGGVASSVTIADPVTPAQKARVDDQGAMSVAQRGKKIVAEGSLATSASPQALGGNIPCEEVVIFNDDGAEPANGNVRVAWIGGPSVAVGSGGPMRPGGSFPIEAANVNLVYAVATGSGDTIHWIALVKV